MGNLTPALGIVCGMASEVRALGRWADDPRIAIGISGARPERAEAEARRLTAAGCRVLMSWGVAGGLDPALVPGDLIVPAEVADEAGTTWAMSNAVIARLDRKLQKDRMPGSSRGMTGTGAILGLDRMVPGAAEKASLHARTGAVAIDMESHRVARVAAEAELPVLVLRAVGDPAGRALPALAARALGADGQPRIGPVVAGLLRRPRDIGALLRVRRDAEAALAALAKCPDTAIPAALEGL
ncbi:MAG: adenosylhopane nucleosidase [Paracoccaceae bacterium]